jgi:glycosyltransferase involved in cell wall biosynthesis
MRILHVITSLRTGGAEKLMVDLLPRLEALGNNVELLLFDGVRTEFMKSLESKGVKIHIARVGGNVYNPRNIISLTKLIKKFDIVHTHNTAPQLFAVLAKCFVFASSVNLVTTEHNTTNRRRDIIYFKYLDRWMYHKYAKIICISEQAEKNLRCYLNDNSSKICTIFNGIDFSHFSNQINNDAKRYKEGKDVKITMVAAFREQKDHQTLIRSISLLPYYFKLQLVGAGDTTLIKKCEALVKDLNLTNRVSFMGMRSDIPAILQSSDIIVLSSHYEGLSLSSLEGMASGKPFVASDVDGLHEIVNGYGLLFPHEDAQALSDILLKLSNDHKYAEQVAQKCQERAKQFDISVMANKYNEIYHTIQN